MITHSRTAQIKLSAHARESRSDGYWQTPSVCLAVLGAASAARRGLVLVHRKPAPQGTSTIPLEGIRRAVARKGKSIGARQGGDPQELQAKPAKRGRLSR